ncbi:hypothetical protein TcasGA2_TC007086 [Tribolium castaneum]|uniref:GYF domain-containing protein n=1 Tax=Tribolium castaneum TaxID=7070 RepID=D2A1L0_TRICA|nr:PREDICTED: PERQ amino acid-rich with GYF domain-containing protein CG11148 [Tribolium castaneum]XP_008192784.1 PREDICTED: PERQ amino acid-rich with GYF domain-containing protein CG11148 [Tribolium castaneum]EFA01526.1 hypothetical protein TcasGA2_TC007086 [Tribolium castaneum]|eukprot:XP_008192783.1 PREDICTED: PERQ amino acid-rich with GYF domain-containing protein CG11148 [Tribolium castaneum]
MTDSSMNFGPAWIRNLRSEGTTGGGGPSGGSRYQLAEYRYGREEMLALFERNAKPPASLLTFKTLYSEQTMVPLALLPTTEEEQRGWQSRPTSISGAPRGRGSSLERGGRVSRGRGGYQGYGRAASSYDSGWGNGEQPDWSPRKEFASRSALIDNWRRVRNNNEEDDGWRNISSGRALHEKWGRSASWRGEGDSEERNGPPERGARANWHENNRGAPLRRSWDNEDHLPEWATENPTEGGGTFDERGAFHGSDDEQDGKRDKRDMLQKSTSQQHIPNRGNPPSLSSSKSTTSLSRSEDSDKYKEEPSGKELKEELFKPKESSPPENDKSKASDEKDERNFEENKFQSCNNAVQDQITPNIDKVDEDFDRLQEDLVLKLVVDEETPKSQQPSANFDVAGVQPPPNLAPPSQDKWYYQDPQGTRQGPFANVEMAEWYKAGYFSNQLHVMRECDERYFLLGELINLCGGENPFLSNIRFPVLKNEAKLPDDMLPYQFLSQLAFKQQVSLRNLAEPWSALTLQQQELAAQRLLMQQQQQQLPPDLPFMQQTTPSNPLMFMINQMQQSNKLPGSVLVDKPPSSVPNQLDPLLVQMGNMHSLQNRMQTPGLHNHLPGSGVPSNLTSSLPPDGLGNTLPNLQTSPIPTLPGMHGNLPTGLPGPINVNRPSMDQLPPGQDNDPITNFLKQFQQQRQLPLDSLWQKQNQFGAPPVSTPNQWPQQTDASISMWDMQTPEGVEKPVQDKEQEKKPKEELSQKELKKRKEQEEKQAKKEADERRKQEQKKQEAERKAAEDKKKKEEEKIRKELEKAKKEAEEKRLRELDEKRRLKEQRKVEEEMRKKNEELKKIEEEKNRREKEKEEKKLAEVAKLNQSQARGASKTAPWCQSNFTSNLNLTDIQKAEKEKRAMEAALQLQKQQLQELQQQQQIEKTGGLQLNWAKKPIEPRKVKSVAEIQAEEQERLAKLTAEARMAAQLKEKEAPVSNSGSIWNGQSLTWANASSTSQWSTNSAGGFWDEVPTKASNKPSTVSKSNSTSAMTTTSKQPKQSKSKTKKEESPKSVNNNNNQTKDEFTDWCYKTLANISADVDIPTFVTFLRDIESAYDVRDYCKEYLGESPATQQFASNFLEKRRSFKPKNNAHKDDMCSPAPAITPSLQHSTEFQEVKGKNKKNKKSRMLKVDSRILGFNVTSAPDRINVGDRDYGDNS